MRAAAADFFRNLVLRQAEAADEALIGARFFHRVEVFALEVFDQRNLARLGVAVLAHDGRDFRESRELCRAQTALARDELIASLGIRQPPHEHGLEHAIRLDRGFEVFERRLVEIRARLVAVRADVRDGEFLHAVFFRHGRSRRDMCAAAKECPEALSPEAAMLIAHVSAPPSQVPCRPARPSNACRRR